MTDSTLLIYDDPIPEKIQNPDAVQFHDDGSVTYRVGTTVTRTNLQYEYVRRGVE